jgi:hypothetical protein
MSHPIAITLGAAAIGISCVATDVLARGGGGGGGGARHRPFAVGYGAGAGTAGAGAAVAAPSYAVPLYAPPSNGRSACGYYLYPRCRKP